MEEGSLQSGNSTVINQSYFQLCVFDEGDDVDYDDNSDKSSMMNMKMLMNGECCRHLSLGARVDLGPFVTLDIRVLLQLASVLLADS